MISVYDWVELLPQMLNEDKKATFLHLECGLLYQPLKFKRGIWQVESLGYGLERYLAVDNVDSVC